MTEPRYLTEGRGYWPDEMPDSNAREISPEKNTIDCGGSPMTTALLETMLHNLNEYGEIHIKNLQKGSVSMLELGAVLGSYAARVSVGVPNR